jgi:hypothetical protein
MSRWRWVVWWFLEQILDCYPYAFSRGTAFLDGKTAFVFADPGVHETYSATAKINGPPPEP